MAITVVSTAQQAHQLQTQVDAAQKSVSTLNTKQAAVDLNALAATAAELRASTQRPLWRVLEYAPFIGATARSTSAAAQAADELAGAAVPLLTHVGTQQTTVGKLMAALDSPALIEGLRAAAVQANNQLSSAPSGSLADPLGRILGISDAVDSAKQSLPNLVSALTTAAKAGDPLRSMLGEGKPTTWLVMAQNPAELRGSGGLFSAYLIVRFTNGNMQIVEAGSRKKLDGEFPNDQQIPYWQAVSPETAGTWGPALGEWASFNIAPDFPTVAKLASAGMAKRGTPVDGVIAIDPAVTAAILLYSLFGGGRVTGDTPPLQDSPAIRTNAIGVTLWIAVTSLLAAFLVIWGLVELATITSYAYGSTPANQQPNAEKPIDINVTGQQWVWTFAYPDSGNLTTSALVVPIDTPLYFNVTSLDVVHSFWVVEMGIKIDANPGAITNTGVTPTKLGTFNIRCAELCGLHHAYMETTITVVTKDQYQQWLRENGGTKTS